MVPATNLASSLWPVMRDWEPNKSRLVEPEPPLLYPRTSVRIKTTAALMAL